MDRADIKMYKDGKDIILVFKNASIEIENLIGNMLGGSDKASFREVPDLEEPPYVDESIPDLAAFVEPPEDIIKKGFDGFVELLVKINNQLFEGEMLERAKKECKTFFYSHNKVMTDTISTLEYKRVKGFVKCFYELSPEIKEQINSSKYSIEEYIDSVMTEEYVRSVAEEIGKTIIIICE